VFNAVGFDGPVTMEEVLCGCRCATSTPGSLTWVSEEFLAEQKVGPWMEMPLWIPREGRRSYDISKARAAGLRFRPLADTIRDTLLWAKTERGNRPYSRTGISAERERELLELWRKKK
jgi:2'-hydroxyisoflavone reductase